MPALIVIYFFLLLLLHNKACMLALHAGNYVFMLLHSHGKKTVRTSRFVIFFFRASGPKGFILISLVLELLFLPEVSTK